MHIYWEEMLAIFLLTHVNDQKNMKDELGSTAALFKRQT